MNYKILLMGAVGLSAGLVAACHDDSSNPSSATPTASSQSLDTAQVLSMAQQTSENSTPIAVNGGAVTLNDTTETSSAIPVAAM